MDPSADYAARLAAEENHYRDFTEVHRLSGIFHYWSNKYLRPKLEAFGFSTPDEMFRTYLIDQVRENPGQPRRYASLGAGNCDLEIGLACALRDAGCANFVIDCFELNTSMLDRGRAASEDIHDCLNFVQADLNEWQPVGDYDAILANQSLHHVLKLKHLLGNVRASLKPEAFFLTSDMIGRNGHRRWPEALKIVREFWRKLPPSYRFNPLLDRYEEQYKDWDCSGEGFEGIRAQDILPLLVEMFEFRLFIGFGNVIDPFIDRSFGDHFDASAEWDRRFIDAVHRRDEEEMTAGHIKPTHMLAVMSKTPGAPLLHHAPLSPRFCVRDPNLAEEDCEFSDDPYEWQSWPHSAERELRIVCEMLRSREDRLEQAARERDAYRSFQDSAALAHRLQKEVEARTEWALRLKAELEQETARWSAWAREANENLDRVHRILEERTDWALSLDNELKTSHEQIRQLDGELQRFAWARPLDRRFHRLLSALHRTARTVLRRS